MLRSLLYTLAWVAVACAPGTDEPEAMTSGAARSPSAARICNPGDLQRCRGPNGCMGARECDRSGLGYSTCSCDSVQVPAAGSGGSNQSGLNGSNVPRSSVPAAPSSAAPQSSSGVKPLDLRMALYDKPDPQECDRDEDCAGGCCIQIGTTLRQCETGSHCTLHWITPAPSSLPRWQLGDFARYTGSFSADVVQSRVQDIFKSENGTIFKLHNQQYWLNDFSSVGASPAVGDECSIVPGKALFNLYVGESDKSIGVRQIPVVLDARLVSGSGHLTQSGVYELEGGGYWKVFSESRSTNPRVLLATPNNMDFWIFTEGSMENPVDPALVRADSTVTRVEPNGFVLANGQGWAYFASPPLQADQPNLGAHVIVYQNALINDEQPDLPILDTTWVDGKSMGGLLLVVPAR